MLKMLRISSCVWSMFDDMFVFHDMASDMLLDVFHDTFRVVIVCTLTSTGHEKCNIVPLHDMFHDISMFVHESGLRAPNT